jgi:hypothetical protein
MTCTYCDAKAVCCSTVLVGHKPEDPAKVATNADQRRVVVVRACIAHAGRLGVPR